MSDKARIKQIAKCRKRSHATATKAHEAFEAHVASGEYQLQCFVCERFKWQDERCALFESTVRHYREKREGNGE